MSHSTPSTCISSAEQLDYIISTSPLPYSVANQLSDFEKRFLPLSSIHRYLLYIKALYRADSDVDHGFELRRSNHLSGNYNQSFYREGYERAFEGINQSQEMCFDNGRVRSFLDLGCSPGGFSNWILEHNTRARGVGVTLGDEDAKYSFSVAGTHMVPSRYHVRFDNIISLVMESIRRGDTPLIPLTRGGKAGEPIDRGYDLVIAGAFPTLEGKIAWWLRVQLVLCQLLLIFTNLSRHGSCVIVVNTKPFRWFVEVITMLRHSFAKVAAVKAANLHATRTSCYLICRDFSASPRRIAQYVNSLQGVLRSLDQISQQFLVHEDDGDLVVGMKKLGISGVTTDPKVNGDPEALMPHLLSDSDDQLFREEHRFILDLFEPLWGCQYNAIHDNFKAIIEKRAGKSSAKDSTPASSVSSWRNPNLTTGLNPTSAFSHWQARGGTSSTSPTFPPTYPINTLSPATNDPNWRSNRTSEDRGSNGARGARAFSGLGTRRASTNADTGGRRK